MIREAMDPNESVTVVVPTRNRAQYLRQTIESILSQEDVAPSVVVVDDASEDETPELVRTMPRTQVIRHDRPTEQRIARNHGAKLAVSKWLAFCDDDDLWAPSKLRDQLSAMKSEGADWCTSSALFVDSGLNPIGGHRLRSGQNFCRLIRERNIVPGGGSGVLVRRALFESVGGFREDAKYVEDWDLWVRLSQAGKVACVDKLLVAYRVWSSSFSHDAFEDQYSAFCALVKNHNEGTSRKDARPKGASAFEVNQRLRSEKRRSILKDLPELVRRTPRDTIPMMLILGLPHSVLKGARLRKVGLKEIQSANEWLSPYRSELGEGVGTS
jgi:glycosyltransferase involved in cell wall biosynthesis